MAAAAAQRHVVLAVRPEDDETSLEQVLESLKAASLNEASPTETPELSWGDWEVRPFCFGMMQVRYLGKILLILNV